MAQSTVVALALAMLFIVYITLRGELGRYLGVFGIGNASAAQGSQGGDAAPGMAGSATQALQTGTQILQAGTQMLQAAGGFSDAAWGGAATAGDWSSG